MYVYIICNCYYSFDELCLYVIYWIIYLLIDVINMFKLIYVCFYIMIMKFLFCIVMFMCYDLLYKWYIFMFIV